MDKKNWHHFPSQKELDEIAKYVYPADYDKGDPRLFGRQTCPKDGGRLGLIHTGTNIGPGTDIACINEDCDFKIDITDFGSW